MEYKIHDIQWTDEKVKRFWDFYNNYPALDKMWFSKAVGLGIITFVSKFFKIQGKVLDYGIGKGYFTEYLLRNKNIEAMACDFSQETVNNVNKKFQHTSNFKGCKLVQGFPSSFNENEFDTLFLIEAIEHLTDDYLLPTIKEAKRVIKTNGYFVVTTPNNESLEEQNIICPDCGGIFHRVQHVRSFTKESLVSLVIDHGFETVFCGATDFGQYGKNKFARRLKNAASRLLRKSYQAPHLVYIGKKI